MNVLRALDKKKFNCVDDGYLKKTVGMIEYVTFKVSVSLNTHVSRRRRHQYGQGLL